MEDLLWEKEAWVHVLVVRGGRIQIGLLCIGVEILSTGGRAVEILTVFDTVILNLGIRQSEERFSELTFKIRALLESQLVD